MIPATSVSKIGADEGFPIRVYTSALKFASVNADVISVWAKDLIVPATKSSNASGKARSVAIQRF
ncbi:MAG: hypothetical protein LBR18_01110 [Tannerella sp.]|nr:hypothetical protein [Tannerella sp.]